MADLGTDHQFKEQTVLNRAYDDTYNSFKVIIKDGSGTSLTVVNDGVDDALLITESNYAIKKTISGSVTYVALAPPGTAQATAGWQAFKKDESVANTVTITWADSNTNFDNVATDLTALTYS
jgi:hypothetical protein